MAPKEKIVIRKVKTPRINPIRTIMSLVPIKEGHPAPSSAPIKGHRRASLGPEQKRSEIKEAILRRLRKKYFILDNIRMTIPNPDDKVLSPLSGCIAFYEGTFNIKFHSLFIP